jgi:hypothetical protein
VKVPNAFSPNNEGMNDVSEFPINCWFSLRLIDSTDGESNFITGLIQQKDGVEIIMEKELKMVFISLL